jgi:beta-barrel assembly-enhancing protease
MKRYMQFATIIVLLTMSVAAHAQFGDLMKNVQRAKRAHDTFTPWSPEQETEIGKNSAAKLIHVFGLYENEPMTRYVNLVGLSLARQSNRRDVPYHFGILDSEVVSAYAMPGGFVFITRGALANMNSEAELAGVLAHEIAHVEGRHLEREVRAKKATSWAVEEGTAKLPAPGVLKNLANEIVTKALTSGYSRDKEDEADKRGVAMAGDTGYDPVGLKNFLSAMATAAAQPENARRLNAWNATHPPYAERVARLENVLAGKNGGVVLDSRFRESIDFTKPAASQTAVASAAPAPAAASPCSLDQAKQRIAYEKEQMSLLGSSGKKATITAPAACSYEQAKLKIQEVQKELGGGDAPADDKTKPAAKKPVKKS